MIVNKKAYARLDLIGKGGSSRVFRVLNNANELYAIKRVSLDKTDAETMSGYMNEIALLKRLNGNSRIIRLIDSEVKPGPGGSKGHLLLVMECGEIDLAKLLQEQQKEPMNMVWISYYWQQMLQAVHIIHEEKIVHSDLKPANFVLVRGQLKLIDFGIANAIANDTTNIQRDHQIGTVNYMSPEAIELPDGMRRLKVDRPSDVWSLGCILYQMVYRHPPFQHLSVYQKMKAIPDLTHVIEFPEHSTPSIPASKNSPQSGSPNPPKKLDHLKRRVRRDVIAGMKSLCRNPKERSTIPELMEQDWLVMKEPDPPAVKELLAPDETIINPYYMRQLLQYGIKVGQSQSAEVDPEELLRDAERLVAELKALEA
jgi:serine/threonine-protein kinase TTK/MPS1